MSLLRQVIRVTNLLGANVNTACGGLVSGEAQG